MSFKFIIPLLGISGSMFAADITPRISIGIAKGLEPTQYEVDKLSTNLGANTTYETNPGVNVEIPVVIAFKGESMAYFIAAPAFLYARNNNTFTIENINAKGSGKDNYTQIGGKLYAGVGFGGQNGFHGELLPYLGFASVDEDVDFTVKSKINGSTASVSSSAKGSLTLYGLTVGAYYSPEGAKGFEIGARLGYVGATGTIEGGDTQQNGGLFALDVGWTL